MYCILSHNQALQVSKVLLTHHRINFCLSSVFINDNKFETIYFLAILKQTKLLLKVFFNNTCISYRVFH